MCIENFVAAVGRAFYTDPFVVVLDALVHEKFIIEEELPPRLKLSTKDVSKITRQLEEEMLIKSESVKTEDGSIIKYLYIDYQVFYYAVLYRINIIQRSLQADEKVELHQTFFKCPTCDETYTQMQVLRQMSGDGKFICTNCCPIERYQTAPSEAYYRLETIDNREKIDAVQLIRSKVDDQLKRSKYHEGILDLLKQLRDVPLGHNLPSENIKKGVRASIIADEDVLANIKHNIDHASGAFGGSRFKGGSAGVAASSTGQQQSSGVQRKLKIQSSAEEDKEDEEKLLANIGINLTAVGAVSRSVDVAEDVDGPAAKKVKVEAEIIPSDTGAAVVADDDNLGEEDEEEEVQWANDDDDNDNDDTQWKDDD